MNTDSAPIIIEEGYWRNSPLSIAKHYGRLKVFGHEYWIVDKHGRDLFECTAIAEKEGRDKAIEPGEPADLCRKDFLQAYKALGRDRLMELLQQQVPEKEIKRIAKETKKGKRS